MNWTIFETFLERKWKILASSKNVLEIEWNIEEFCEEKLKLEKIEANRSLEKLDNYLQNFDQKMSQEFRHYQF